MSDETQGIVSDPIPAKREIDWLRIAALGVLPAVALVLAGLSGLFKWQYSSQHDAEVAAAESVAVARDTTIAILSYGAKTVDKDLNAARDRLTGPFLDSYTDLVNTVVIPGAREKQISATAQVPAAASMSASPSHAEALLFVNQTVTMGKDAPSNTTSSVRVTLDKVGQKWLVSGFEPV